MTLPALGMLGVWFIHYINRAIIYPIRLRTQTRRIPLLVCGLAFLFNSFNAYIFGALDLTLEPTRPTG